MDSDKPDRRLEEFHNWFDQWEQTARVLFITAIGSADILRKDDPDLKLSDKQRRELAEIVYQNTTHLSYQWSRISSYLRLCYGEKILLEAIDLADVVAEVLEYLELAGVDIEAAIEDNLPPIRGNCRWLTEAILGCITDWYYPTRRYHERLAHTIRANLKDEAVVQVQVRTIAQPDLLFGPYTGIDTARLVVEQHGGQFSLDYSHQAAEVNLTLLPWDEPGAR
jgi:hypothetical protein